MRRVMTLPARSSLSGPAAAMLTALLPAYGFAAAPCSGHKLLPKPRPEASCLQVLQQVYASPDKALRALVLPVDVSLYATPDMESRVVIRTSNGDTLTSKDYSSPRGANGYYVHAAKWSPDSRFFVFSLVSSGGHSPWSYPNDGLLSPAEPVCEIQRHDRRQADIVGRLFLFRAAYRDRHHLEATGGIGRRGHRDGRSRAGIREVAAVVGVTGPAPTRLVAPRCGALRRLAQCGHLGR
jgi:hypothetical protein